MLCKNCGTNSPDNIIQCPQCGAALPRPIKIFKPEPEKSLNTLRIVIMLALLFAVTGIALFKLYFISKPDREVEPDTIKQTAKSEKQDSSVTISESEKEEPASGPATHDQTSPNIRRESSIDNDGIGHSKKRAYTNPIENLENNVEKEFRKKEGSHFTVKFAGGENSDIGHLISIMLEEAYIKVGSDIGYYPEDRIEAVLYTQQQFTDITRAPSWTGAIYDGRIKIPIGGITNRTSLLERVLFHEYTHALVHRLSKGRAPMWLNEGIAQYEEGSANEGINQILAQVAQAAKPLPLRPFEGSFMGFNNVQATVAYSISLSATEYIINEFGISAVKRILENLG